LRFDFANPKGLTAEQLAAVEDEVLVISGGDGTNGVTITRLGLGNVRLGAVKHPSRTVSVMEASAGAPWSWHEPSSRLMFNDARNVVSFVDDHVSYIKIFKDDTPYKGMAIFYNPPASYDYQWSPN